MTLFFRVKASVLIGCSEQKQPCKWIFKGRICSLRSALHLLAECRHRLLPVCINCVHMCPGKDHLLCGPRITYYAYSCWISKYYFQWDVFHLIRKNYQLYRASLVAQVVHKNLPAMQETQVQSLGWEDPLEKEMAPYSNSLAWEFHAWRSLAGYTPWGLKSLTWLCVHAHTQGCSIQGKKKTYFLIFSYWR